MAKKKNVAQPEEIIYSEPTLQPITETIEKNYMPYVMSVIISRAIPEIDGLKPSHRKLLYTMYTMGLLNKERTKSANIVGQTMKLNPHGDAAIYETLVRLTRDNETLLHPFVDSKGNFGKQYSSETQYAASRYTECKLEKFCEELFRGIDKNAVDMVDNYDGTLTEPTLLPTTFPNVLVTPNMGIAVGMASNICSFNLNEICDGTIALLKNPKTSTEKMMTIVKAPDFSGGGEIIYDEAQMRQIYETGSGSVRIRSVYEYDKKENCIDIRQIPYSTSIELIVKKIVEMIKEGKLRDCTDVRDETDLNGLKLTIDLRRGVDPDKLMKKLFKSTPLEDSFKCNFNILINSVPRQMGIVEILTEWIKFRMQCVRRELTFDLEKKEAKLHLLLGLGKILLDIDKAIRIIRQTEKEEDVVPNLEEGFSIDKIQAEYIADIKLRNLNREYILNRIKEIEGLQAEIAELKDILGDEIKIKNYIIKQLQEIKKKYGKPRLSSILYTDGEPEFEEEEPVENYNVRLVLSNDGYFKKITFQSLKGNDEQKFKEGDFEARAFDAENIDNVIFFTNKCQVYRAKVDDFDCTKASALGDFLPAKLEMDEGEKPIFMKIQNNYPENENFIFVFENGKGVRVPVSSYQTKGNRRKLIGAYSDASPIVSVFYETEPVDILMKSTDNKAIVVKSSLIPIKTTRSAAGVNVFTLKKGNKIASAEVGFEDKFDSKGFKKLKIPAVGVVIPDGEQLSF
ncbi:MAG: topoisomerase IV [Clostridia bacterium]|nr:topoisomerase IV [Clostridia bacterium]